MAAISLHRKSLSFEWSLSVNTFKRGGIQLAKVISHPRLAGTRLLGNSKATPFSLTVQLDSTDSERGKKKYSPAVWSEGTNALLGMSEQP